MKVLVINAGSTTLKYQFINLDTNEVIAKGLCDRIGIDGSYIKHTPIGKDAVKIELPMESHTVAIEQVIAALTDKDHGVITDMKEISAVGHRVVHGGEYFSESVIVDDDVKRRIEECIALAPLHNPANLTGILACEKVIPGAPQVAVFDTAFHQTMPAEAYTYAIPSEFYDKYKIRRYGFHGTSHKYVSMRAAEMLSKPADELRIITIHLGGGSSLAAIRGGKCIDTSMGFTPLAGLVMGTRSGDIDPAIVGFLAEAENMTAQEVCTMLNKKSGVAGLSKITSDFRDLELMQDTNETAKFVLDVFEYSLKKYIGQYVAALGGVDALVFTAGVGENNRVLRKSIANHFEELLGTKIDDEKNSLRGVDIDISAEDAKTRILVIPTNEELMIALDTQKLLSK